MHRVVAPRTARAPAAAILVAAALLLPGCGEDDQVQPNETAVSTTGAPGTAPPTTESSTTTGGDKPVPLDGLEEATSRWEAAGIDDYTMSYRRTCFCPAYTVQVTVVDGEVTSAEAIEGLPGELPPTTQPIPDDEQFTVEDLFGQAIEAYETADRTTVTYDAELGYPTIIDVDPIQNAIDDEYTLTVESFEAT
jgi:hypothetical protein